MKSYHFERLPASMDEARLWVGEDLHKLHATALHTLADLLASNMSAKNRARAIDKFLLDYALSVGLMAAKYKVYGLTLNPSMN